MSPTDSQVEGELARIVAAAPFRDAPQLKAFLEFVVRETLAGRGGDLKGYAIATLALGRPDSFDPQVDPIVRVQAGRVRQALTEFYNAHPASELRIALERGSYAPVFIQSALQPTGLSIEPQVPDIGRPPATEEASRAKPVLASPTPATRQPRFSPRVLILAIGCLLLGALAAAWLVRGRTGNLQAEDLPYSAFVPALVVEADTQDMASDLGVLAARTRDAIARFDDIVVVQDNPDMAAALPSAADARPGIRIALRINGAAAGQDQMRFTARLIDRADQHVLWSREYDPAPSGPAGDRPRSDIVRSIAASIARPYGVIHTHVRKQLKPRQLKNDPYDCIVASFDYWLSNDAKNHLAARQCLESRLAVYPGSHPLHALMTYLLLEEHRQGYNALPGSALDRALHSAQKAVHLAPSSARSHQALLAAHFARNEMELAWAAAAKAMELNPYDTEIIEDIGARHVQSGNYEKGLELLQKSLDINNAPPTWAVTFRVIALYMLGRTDQSSPIAITLRNSNYGLAMVAVMMGAAEKGRIDEANEAYNRLVAIHPAIASDLSAYLKRLVFDEKTARQIAADFERAKAWIAANRK